MYKSTLALAVLGMTAFGFQSTQTPPYLMFKEETITLEYTATSREAVIKVAAETEEGVDRVEIRNPAGEPIFNLRAQNGEWFALSGFLVETMEFSVEELSKTYAEGIYDIRGRTSGGRGMLGSASLSHELLEAPIVSYPLHDAEGIPVDLTVSWFPNPDAIGYEVGLEQGDSDGLKVKLPPSTTEFQVPLGVLRGNTETQVEVGAIGANGNCTLVEVVFWTQ